MAGLIKYRQTAACERNRIFQILGHSSHCIHLSGLRLMFFLPLALTAAGGRGRGSVDVGTAVLASSIQSVALCEERRKCSHCVLNLVTSSNFNDY